MYVSQLINIVMELPNVQMLVMKHIQDVPVKTGAWDPAKVFICSCLFPLVALFPMLFLIVLKKEESDVPQASALSEESKAVISVLQGPYEDDEQTFTLYWEAMVSLRRLLVTGMTIFVNYASIQMIVITVLCLIFLNVQITSSVWNPIAYRSAIYVMVY